MNEIFNLTENQTIRADMNVNVADTLVGECIIEVVWASSTVIAR